MAGKHWVQYHTPARMGYGINECGVGPPFQLVTSKDCRIHNPEKDIAWVVGLTEEVDSPVLLGCWFRVDAVEASSHPDFLYQFVGDEGGSCDPLPVISDRDWYPRLTRMTTAFRRGLTEVTDPRVLAGLREAAAEVGIPRA